MIIALSYRTQSTKPSNYEDWLLHFDPTLEFIALNEVDESEYQQQLKKCSGIIFTGGADVHPEHYGKSERIGDCSTDVERDTREFILAELCASMQIPVLGICRGEQFYAVFSGGSLIVDIQKDTGSVICHTTVDGNDSIHPIDIQAGTLLRKITRVDDSIVNSAHHQAVEHLPELLAVSAYSTDGIIEAFEWADTTGKPFFLALQWHPERMDYSSPCSGTIAQHFLYEAESYSLLLQ